MNSVALYDYHEVCFESPADSAVLRDCCTVETAERTYSISAFRKENHRFAVRIMADCEGIVRYTITLVDPQIHGEFLCDAALPHSHGPVCAQEDAFYYKDGVRYFPFGTTSYAWTHQDKELQDKTIKTLQASCFNKIRMLVFPKFMPYNEDEPSVFPFERDENGEWDVNRIVPAYWDNLDYRLQQLGETGIEADLILFHPYDKWGFADLSRESSLLYVRYCIARLSAVSNLWWSLANEHEMVVSKTEEDWDEIGRLLAAEDPWHHLISIHQIIKPFPKRDWMTHCSIQSGNINYIPLWKREYQMPIIIDECGYEGDLEFDWGNLSAFEMVNRFWWTVTRGGYCTHGETFHREDEILWWGKGGVLYGQSEPRIRFLKELLESLPGIGKASAMPNFHDPNFKGDHEPSKTDKRFIELVTSAGPELLTGMLDSVPKQLTGDGWILRYFAGSCPCMTHLPLGEEEWSVEIIDVWEMTRTKAAVGSDKEKTIRLPAKPGIAVLAVKM